MINYGHGPAPAQDEAQPQPQEMPGGVLEPGDTGTPSLTPKQIATFSSQFLAETTSYYYSTWQDCVGLVGGFRQISSARAPSGNANALATFLRPRDVNVNIVQPLFRNVVARLSLEQPSAVVVPATPSSEDIIAAQAGEQALKYFWREAKVKKVLTECVEWAALLGTSGLHTKVTGEGDKANIRVESISPDKLRAEPGVGNPDDSRFLGVVTLTTKEVLKSQFPDMASVIDQAPPPTTPYGPSTSQFGTKAAPDRVEVLQAYCRSGHWFTLCGEAVLAQGFTPGSVMPIEVIRYTKIPGQFFGMGMVEPNTSIQYGFSSVFNSIMRNARLMGNPKWLINRQSRVDENACTSREGEKIMYDGVAPTTWVPPPLPAYMQQLPAMLQSYSHDVTGIHSTTSGKRAVGISSGRAIEALTANDLAQLQSTQDSIVEAVEGMSKTALTFIKAYYPETKVMRTFDQFGKTIFRAIQSGDLSEQPEVFIEADTLFTATVKDRDQKTLDLLRLGMIDAKTAKKMLSYHLDPMAPLEEVASMQHAQDVLGEVLDSGYWLLNPATGLPEINPATGQPRSRVTIYPTDNLELFERVVKDFMQSQVFWDLDQKKGDDVDALYQEIIKMQMAALPVDPNAPKPELNSNGNPKGMGEPGAPDMPQMLPGNMDTTAGADAQVEAVEADVGVG